MSVRVMRPALRNDRSFELFRGRVCVDAMEQTTGAAPCQSDMDYIDEGRTPNYPSSIHANSVRDTAVASSS
jgi:hypothetical protein